MKQKQQHVPLMVAELAELAEKATANAHRYLDDSRILLEAGRWPSAHALATLGLEEMGKACFCATVLGMPAEIRAQFGLQEAIASHKNKLALAYLHLWILRLTPTTTSSEVIRIIEQRATDVNDAKFRGMYVDHVAGVTREPTDEIDETSARARVTDLDELISLDAKYLTVSYLLELIHSQGDGRAAMDGIAARILALLQADEETALPGMMAMLSDFAGDSFDWDGLIAEGKAVTGPATKLWRP